MTAACLGGTMGLRAVSAGVVLAVLACAGVARAAERPVVEAHLLKDIVPGKEQSGPYCCRKLGDTAYFFAYRPRTGVGLWRTDGTRKGTRLAVDIYRDDVNVSPHGFDTTGEYLFFTVLTHDQTDDPQTREVWRSGGTPQTTGPVPGLPAGVDSRVPRTTGPLAFFEAAGAVWVTDGKSPALNLGQVGRRFAVGDSVFFFRGPELWTTDGTEAGTRLVTTGVPPPASAAPVMFRASLYYLAAGAQLWRTDGTAAGSAKVSDLPPPPLGAGSIERDSLAAADDAIVFTLGGRELWRSDGTAAGTWPLGVSTEGEHVEGVTRVGNRLLLSVEGEPWTSDGTVSGTRRISGKPSIPYAFFAELGPLAVFAATGPRDRDTRSAELWQTDWTRKGTRPVRDIWPGNKGSRITSLHPVGRRVVFSAYRPDFGEELWVAQLRR